MPAERTTLARFLIDHCSHHARASGDLNALVLDVALACKATAKRLSYGALGGVLDDPHPPPPQCSRGECVLVFDAVDRSSDIDTNVAVGSVFSVWQRGSEQVCAGYAIYGPATVLVLTVGAGVHGFTLDPGLGEFLLTHRDMRIRTGGGRAGAGRQRILDLDPLRQPALFGTRGLFRAHG